MRARRRSRRRSLLDRVLESDSFAAALVAIDRAVAARIEGLSKVQADVKAARIHADAIDADFVDLPVQDAPADPEVPRKSGSIVAIPSTRARGDGEEPRKKAPCPECGTPYEATRGLGIHFAAMHPGKELSR